MTKLALVCSSGGHLFELYCLGSFWKDNDRFWISFPTDDAKTLLENEKVFWAYFPTSRNVANLIKNLYLALTLLPKQKPDVIISTGAGVAVPFIIAGKLLKIRTVYLESIARNQKLSLSGRLVYPIVDEFLVQWPELAVKYKKAKYQGRVI